MFKRDLVANVKRVWQVLLSVESVPSSPLLGLTSKNLWVTASNYTLRRHLRYVAFRMGTQWDARVIADATLITAWLSTAKNIRDPDVLTQQEDGKRNKPSDNFLTLVDLAAPFDLLILRLGVKAAKNREMPNVLAEAINEREILGKPTWIVDSPLKPLGPGHICYSDTVADMLDGFKRVVLPEEDSPTQQTNPYALNDATLAGAGVANPAHAAQPMGLGNYRARGVVQEAPPHGPPPQPKPVIVVDNDDCGVDTLLSEATDFPPPVVEEEEIPESAFDATEDPTNYPSVEEIQNENATQGRLAKMLLTKEARKTAEARAKKDKRFGPREDAE